MRVTGFLSISTVAACVALIGCNGCAGFLNPAAESVVSVRGRVANADPAEECGLELYSNNGKSLQHRPIPSEFKTSLVIAPGAHKYYVEISCPGHTGLFRSPVYDLGGGTRSLDLGVVALR